MRTPKRLAVIGATGAVGSTFCAHLLRRRLLQPHDELILVGHGNAASDSRLLAERIDLQDAFDEQEVTIRIVPTPDHFEADVVVVTAGLTIGPDHPTRGDLASANIELFRQIAQTTVRRQPNTLYIVVSNPVELAVDIFSRETDPHHVVGMGAQQDSLRFARCVAEKLEVTRHKVRASVLGEHGASMFPVWSSVALTEDDPQLHDRLAALRSACPLATLPERIAATRARAESLVAASAFPQAYEYMSQADPDARIFVEPFITARLLHSTPNATSNATLDCVEAAFSDGPLQINGQVRCSSFLGIDGVCGLPLSMNRRGWCVADEPGLTGTEIAYLQECSHTIATSVEAAKACGDTHATA